MSIKVRHDSPCLFFRYWPKTRCKCAPYSPATPLFMSSFSRSDSIWMRHECQVEMWLRPGSQQSVDNAVADVSSWRVPHNERSIVFVATVRTDSDRLKLVCEYEMPAVTHPIVPPTLLLPELVFFFLCAVLTLLLWTHKLFSRKYEQPWKNMA